MHNISKNALTSYEKGCGLNTIWDEQIWCKAGPESQNASKSGPVSKSGRLFAKLTYFSYTFHSPEYHLQESFRQSKRQR